MFKASIRIWVLRLGLKIEATTLFSAIYDVGRLVEDKGVEKDHLNYCVLGFYSGYHEEPFLHFPLTIH